ncbi:hypothetical protein AWZ03_014758, partial [Drosophila navojoa]
MAAEFENVWNQRREIERKTKVETIWPKPAEVLQNNPFRAKRASKDQGRHYNLRRREWRPALGSAVLLRQHQLSNTVEGFAAKLAPKFDGLYKVVKFLSPKVVRLAKEGERNRRVANIAQLKPFHRGDVEIDMIPETETGFPVETPANTNAVGSTKMEVIEISSDNEDASSDSPEPFSREEAKAKSAKGPEGRYPGGNDATTRGVAAIPSPPTGHPGVGCAELLGGRSFVDVEKHHQPDSARITLRYTSVTQGTPCQYRVERGRDPASEAGGGHAQTTTQENPLPGRGRACLHSE